MSTPAAIPTAVSGRSALEVARSCAQEAGERAHSRFRRPQEVRVKGRGNLLTETDLEIEAFIQERLAQEFPDHAVLSEESAAETSREGWAWIVDPLDGTRNFVSGIPFFCVNIALCHEGEPAVAVTYDPNHREAFWAERGGGAWVNDQPARASAEPSLQASVLGVDLGYDDLRGRALLHLVHQIFPGMQAVRIPGSAALGIAYAACGRYDIFVHHYLFPWDIAAGILLVREAGGTITDGDGQPVTITSQTVIAGGREVHADFLRRQREYGAEPDV